MLITCHTMSQPCCLHMASRCVMTPHGHSLERLPYDQKPRSLPNVLGHPRLIPSVCWNFWCLWCRTIHAQRRQPCEKLRQPETPSMLMWRSCYSANRQVATVSPMALSWLSLSQMSLFPISLSPMSLSLKYVSLMSLSQVCALMAR